MPRLHVIVRADLPVGAQFAQAIHAATAFATAYHPLADMPVAVVTAADQVELLAVILTQDPADSIVMFTEPDMDNAITAAACIARSDSLRHAVASLPLIGEGR